MFVGLVFLFISVALVWNQSLIEKEIITYQKSECIDLFEITEALAIQDWKLPSDK
jgi:hypothetical protein